MKLDETKKRPKPVDVLPDIIPGLLVAWRELVEGMENLAANPHAQSGDVEAARNVCTPCSAGSF